MNSRGRKQEGFTLLELLVAMTVFSLLLIALSEGLHFAGRAWRAQEEQIGREGDINAVQTVLREMLASAQSFEGGPQKVTFVGRMPAALARGGLFDIELSTGGDRLVLSWRPHFKGVATAGVHPNSAVLLEGVSGLNLSYYTGQVGWQHVVNGNPKSMESIDIRAHLSGGRPWPDLIISPAIDASSSPKS